jgi:predicted cupin superfamily sugar epimerase
MADRSAQYWIDRLQLERHPEGGWFRRAYTSPLMVDGHRPALTSIHYLLEGGDFSALHRLKQDEQWHFYTGAPLTLHIIGPEGMSAAQMLGPGGPFQATVSAGDLFGASVSGEYALVGCTVAPGFDYADFELPPRETLLRAYPQHGELILRLTRPKALQAG